MKQKKQQKPHLGDFIMRNNQCSALCRGGQEKGIVLNDKYYLHIDSLFTARLSRPEAQKYGKMLKFPLPTQKQIMLLADNIEKINGSLRQVGLGDCMLFGDMLHEFWTRRAAVNQPDDERRRVIFILPI